MFDSPRHAIPFPLFQAAAMGPHKGAASGGGPVARDSKGLAQLSFSLRFASARATGARPAGGGCREER